MHPTSSTSASTRRSSDGAAVPACRLHRLRLSERNRVSVGRSDRRLPLSHRSRRRRVHCIQPISSFWPPAAPTGRAFGPDHVAVLHDLRALAAAATSRPCREGLQRGVHATLELSNGHVRLFRRILYHPIAARDVVRFPALHGRASNAPEGLARQSLQHLLPRIALSFGEGHF